MDTTFFMATMNVIGTIAFAISGAMVAIDREMDVFGVNILAIATATFGGLLRDLIIGHTPPVMFQDPTYVAISIIVANLVFVYAYLRQRSRRDVPRKLLRAWDEGLLLCDALGLAAFTVTGTYIGLDPTTGPNVFLMVTLGVLTGVGGGLIRDMFAMRKPLIFMDDIYAVASLVGGVAMCLFYLATGQESGSFVVGFVLTLGIRMLAVKRHWRLPRIVQSD